ncbi:MAG: hypothetical protein ACSW8D_07515, partial [Prevotella sp.]
MLHSESWQGGAQNHRALIIIGSIFLALNISACKQQAQVDEDALRREQIYRQYSLDAQLHLDILISNAND